MQPLWEVATAQENRPDAPAGALAGAVATRNLGEADGALSLGLTGERRPLYRLRKSDVLEVNFTFSPEFNQTVTVQPDGFLMLKSVGPLYAEGLTVTALQESIVRAYRDWLHDPEVTVTLRDFDKPYFIASGEVVHPGKYELRADTTVTEAVAIAGGFTHDARHSQVVLFRRVSDELAETRLLDMKKLLRRKNLKEDVHLRSGDLVFIPQNTISKIRKYLPLPTAGMYLNPTQF
jgi:polysaccharide export outer membrane protein